MAVTVEEVVSRPAAPTVIETPLPRALGPGEPARGVARMQLAMATRHYAGNTGVPDGLPAVEWSVNRFDPQSGPNPVEDGIRHVPIVTLDVPPETHLTEHTWTGSHQLGVRVTGQVVETTVNGVLIDRRELEGDQLRRSGSIGFDRGASVNINRVAIRSLEGGAGH